MSFNGSHHAIGGGNMMSNSEMDSGDTESVMVIKKEINLSKAYKKFNRNDVDEVMKKELKGIVARKVWNFFHKTEITKELAKEEDEFTGYQGDLLLDISPELTGMVNFHLVQCQTSSFKQNL